MQFSTETAPKPNTSVFSKAGCSARPCRWEERVYEYLGIKKFRQFVLLIEKVVQKRRGRSNRNYHLGCHASDGLETYQMYINLNSFIHGSAQLILLFSLLLCGLFLEFRCKYTIALLILFVANGYCLMLQRYNTLRLRRIKARAKQHQASMAGKLSERLHTKLYGHVEYLPPLQKLSSALKNKTSLLLTHEDGVLLTDLAVQCHDDLDVLFPALPKKTALKPFSDERTLFIWPEKNVPYHFVQFAAALLNRCSLSFPVIAAEDPTAEKAFCVLFGISSVWMLETRLYGIESAITGGDFEIAGI